MLVFRGEYLPLLAPISASRCRMIQVAAKGDVEELPDPSLVPWNKTSRVDTLEVTIDTLQWLSFKLSGSNIV